RMMQAGFSYESILRIINSALIVKSGDESLSTLDAVQIDLFTGYARGLKAGAADSFVYSNGRLTHITSSSLPIGILRDIDANEYEECLSYGDVFVMVSDGVVADDCAWLEELICRLASEGADETEMANEIVFHARERQEADRTDDTTALVLRIA
ncbi:MAG: SpoIIE family protein phosphatase, partial [Clostridia bacterium]|nr:SpoIIE family protein phosphatase [Clostridia bacterium]